VLFFSSSRVLLRTLIPVPGFAEILGLLIALTFVILTFKVLDLKEYNINKYGIVLFLFGIFSIIRYLIAGKSSFSSLPGMLTWIAILGFIAARNNEIFIRLILKAFTIAMCMHLFSIIIPFDFIHRGLDTQTSYGVSRYGSNIFSARSTGFNQAPGVLSFFSAQGLVIGIIMYYYEKRAMWLILILTSLICGILTFNRSFIFLLVIITFIVPMFMDKVRRIASYYVILGSVIALFLLAIFKYSDYERRITDRFEVEIFEKAIDTRLQGEAGIMRVLKAISNYPLLGSFVYDEYSDRHYVLVGENEGYVLVHNGIANIFATRGIIFGSLFVLLSVLAFIGFYKTNKNDIGPSSFKSINKSFYAAFIVGQIFCLSESFTENFLMLALLSFGLIQKVNYENQKSLHNYYSD